MKNKKKRILIGISLAILVGIIGYALSPVSGNLFAGAKSNCRQVVEGSETAGAVYMNCRKVTVYYNETTCAGKCAMIPSLPLDAKEHLTTWFSHKVVTSWAYIRVLDQEKNSADLWYTVCFSPRDAADVYAPTIYSFHPDTSWTPENYFRDDAGNMCTNHLGESSFVLMGWEK